MVSFWQRPSSGEPYALSTTKHQTLKLWTRSQSPQHQSHIPEQESRTRWLGRIFSILKWSLFDPSLGCTQFWTLKDVYSMSHRSDRTPSTPGFKGRTMRNPTTSTAECSYSRTCKLSQSVCELFLIPIGRLLWGTNSFQVRKEISLEIH